ncbi:phosphoribosyl-ATP diphosphatase [Clostridium sp. SHJSY1]|uniref:phosphoribosyl-ATP diphosphatase n=1 Tax=Clostridium sp. SHJSY1 TaxID=2942483 RepID=UPI0028752BD1|nr:phosphoribosyl-ATP diphosphatase [Clostridium sp. SHJSY1]MDS0525057.1 phosphoribosyl-ATP diphosphatase [Clostridium sp. SHJSY1]
MSSVIKELYSTILDRKKGGEEGSYTVYLFNKGKEKILKKVGEEATEVVISSLSENKVDQVNEICDLTYHLLVLMAELDIPVEMVEEELIKRESKINNFKGERKEIENL